MSNQYNRTSIKHGQPLVFEHTLPNVSPAFLLAQDIEDREIVRKDSSKNMHLTRCIAITELIIAAIIISYVLLMYWHIGYLQDRLLEFAGLVVAAIFAHTAILLRSANSSTWSKFGENKEK